jgi:hypothetical protein
MATSRQNSIFGVSDWKRLYETFTQSDFQSYDYETLRKSFVDYIRLYYPENFNDYIESSEFISLLDVIAFMGQGLAFRNDLNTRENFIDTAERRDSVIKLANLIGYTPKRNIASEGYIKVIGIKTSESVFDVNGSNLNNVTILWNDPANSNWLEQFNSIINSSLIDTQRIGKPGNSNTLLGVKTDEYSIRLPDNVMPIVPYTSTVDTINMNFELVSSTVKNDSIYELPPSPNSKMNILYRNDKLGYGSSNTGFFFYFKQGTLQSYDFNLEQKINNQLVDINNIEGVNNSDTWLYQINSNNTRTLWTQTENLYSSVLQNITAAGNRKLFSVKSRFNDQVSYVFGDGVFSEIPVGTYRAYLRSSNGLSYTIDPSEMSNVDVSLNYVSRYGKVETLTLSLQLQSPVNNSQPRESIANIKLRAPTRYYTQNRMVNGEDYSNFPFTLYGSIIKSTALNRTSIGISRNLDLLDPTQKYSSTNAFSNDGALYQNSQDSVLNLTINNLNQIITFLGDTLPNALNSYNSRQYYVQKYNRYSPSSPTIYWKTVTSDSNTITGYFYYPSFNLEIPVSIGSYSTTNMKYATSGCLIKFTAPIINGVQYYFDPNNRLTTVSTSPNSLTTWAYINNVVGDGSNFGRGTFPNGSGPVTLNVFIPSGSVITQIIPQFSNVLPSSVVSQCTAKMQVNQNFSLIFDNSLSINSDRWIIGAHNSANYYVNFTSTGSNTYSITYRSLKYKFGSVSDIRFVYDSNNSVYDPRSGVALKDYVKVLASNYNSTLSSPLGRDIVLYITGQDVESDGYVNNFEVNISSTETNNSQIITNPDFFTDITGYNFSITPTPTNTRYFVFFKLVQDSAILSRYVLLDSSEVVSQYGTLAEIELVKYDYPLGQLYYAYNQNTFYISEQISTVLTPSYVLTLQPANSYIMQTGRTNISFQYRHNSNNTRRVDPSTTNIIDLYVVTQSYYNDYKKWISDTTGKVVEPTRPTISQLSSLYSGQLNNYKMISDSVVLNSVVFKPLFGPKAAANLRAKIKVIKSSVTTVSDSEIRSKVLSYMNEYFSINNWDFGDTFYFSELSAYLHGNMSGNISSVVLVPTNTNNAFGTLYEIKSGPYEIFVNAATTDDIVVISALTPDTLNMR